MVSATLLTVLSKAYHRMGQFLTCDERQLGFGPSKEIRAVTRSVDRRYRASHVTCTRPCCIKKRTLTLDSDEATDALPEESLFRARRGTSRIDEDGLKRAHLTWADRFLAPKFTRLSLSGEPVRLAFTRLVLFDIPRPHAILEWLTREQKRVLLVTFEERDYFGGYTYTKDPGDYFASVLLLQGRNPIRSGAAGVTGLEFENPRARVARALAMTPNLRALRFGNLETFARNESALASLVRVLPSTTVTHLDLGGRITRLPIQVVIAAAGSTVEVVRVCEYAQFSLEIVGQLKRGPNPRLRVVHISDLLIGMTSQMLLTNANQEDANVIGSDADLVSPRAARAARAELLRITGGVAVEFVRGADIGFF